MAFGVPPLLNQIGAISNPVALLFADAKIVSGLFSNVVQWGVFLDGKLAINADSVVSVEVKKEYHVPNYPQENGAFQSYNKVQLPQDTRVRITKGGSQSDRVPFLATLDDIVASLDLYDIVTADNTYHNANITRYEIRRTAESGVSMLTVDLIFTEIRNKATAQFISTATPSGAKAASTGAVTPATVVADKAAAFKAKFAAKYPLFKPL